MNPSTPFAVAARNWIAYLSSKRKLTKRERQAVMGFGSWLDTFIQKQEMEQELKEEQLHAKEN